MLTIAWTAYAAGAVAGALALHLIDYPMIVPAALRLQRRWSRCRPTVVGKAEVRQNVKRTDTA